MPAPTIYPQTSWLVYRQGQFFDCQLQASDSPTSWTASGLPDGLEISNTGLIAGSSLGIGVYDVLVKASNSLGTSADFILTIVLFEAEDSMDEAVMINIDLDSGAVESSAGKGDETPVLYPKSGARELYSIGFTRSSGAISTMEMVSIEFVLREFQSERTFVLNDGAFGRSLTGLRYYIIVPYIKAKLRGVLSSYRKDREAAFDAVAEIRWTWQRVGFTPPDLEELRRTSQNFKVRLGADMFTD